MWTEAVSAHKNALLICQCSIHPISPGNAKTNMSFNASAYGNLLIFIQYPNINYRNILVSFFGFYTLGRT